MNLTDAGRTFTAELRDVLWAEEAEMPAGVSDADMEAVMRALGQIDRQLVEPASKSQQGKMQSEPEFVGRLQTE